MKMRHEKKKNFRGMYMEFIYKYSMSDHRLVVPYLLLSEVSQVADYLTTLLFSLTHILFYFDNSRWYPLYVHMNLQFTAKINRKL